MSVDSVGGNARQFIDRDLDPPPYTGCFVQGTKAPLIGRYSTCCTEVRRGRKRSLSLVGKLFLLESSQAKETETGEVKNKTASFITQQDLGGDKVQYINQAEFRNVPDTTAWRRGLGPNGLPVISITGLLFKLVDVEPAIRQLYEIAELAKDADQPTRTPPFMRVLVDENQPKIDGVDLDFRDEIMGQIYDPGEEQYKRELVFHIEVADEGESRGPIFFQRRKIEDWRRIGKMVFTEGVVSYNGDHLIHFNHPAWRSNRHEPNSKVRRAGQRLD